MRVLVRHDETRFILNVYVLRDLPATPDQTASRMAMHYVDGRQVWSSVPPGAEAPTAFQIPEEIAEQLLPGFQAIFAPSKTAVELRREDFVHERDRVDLMLDALINIATGEV